MSLLLSRLVESDDPPSVSTVGSSNVIADSADVTGDVTDLGTASSVAASFEYRKAGTTGWPNQTTVQQKGTGQYTQTLSGLSSDTQHEFRAKADGDGVDTGQIQTFTTDSGTTAIQFDFETGDTSRWDDVNDLSAVTGTVYNGSYSGHCDNAQSGTYQARVVPPGYSGGKQPGEYEYYWYETDDSFGGGIRLFNSNGNVEVGTATDNPEWDIDDGNGVNQVYGGDGYGRWVRFRLTFDWGAGTFSADFEDLQSGSSFTDSGRPLKQGVDIERIQIEDYNKGGWAASGDVGDGNIEQWFDDIHLATVSPSVSTVGSSNVSADSADVTGDLTDLGAASSVAVSVQFRETGMSTWQRTTSESKTATGQYTQTVSGLSSDTQHEFRARADGDGIDTGAIQTFTTGTEGPQAVIYEDADDYETNNALNTVSDHAFSGTTSAYHSGSGDPLGVAAPSELSGGGQPSEIQWYYREGGSSSVGGAISFHDANGDIVAGGGSSNPEWMIYSGDGWNQIYSGDGYKRWVRFQFDFDWSNYQFNVAVEDMQSGSTASDTSLPLDFDTDIAELRIRPFSSPPDWDTGRNHSNWYDALKITL